jgi:hypothetical protein
VLMSMAIAACSEFRHTEIPTRGSGFDTSIFEHFHVDSHT